MRYGITPDGVLIDAKGHYSQFLDENGEFKDWFNTGGNGFLTQARRQIDAANGTPITWYFLEKTTKDSTEKLFIKNGIKDISLVYKPY